MRSRPRHRRVVRSLAALASLLSLVTLATTTAKASEASEASAEKDGTAKEPSEWVVPGECDRGQLPRAEAVFVTEAPVLDGVLDDPVWQEAEVITNLTQVVPVFCSDPSFRSEIRIVTDGDTLFFSLRAYDPEPDKIVANRMARSEILFYDDGFNIQLDTFHDRRNGFFFQVNPNGGRRDGSFARDFFEENWDGIWYASARIDDKGWVAEVAIPFKTLPFRPGADVWGLQLSRRVRRMNEEIRWADPSLQRFGINMSRAGTLHGMDVAQQGLGLDVVPTFSMGAVIDGEGQDNYPVLTPGLPDQRDFDNHSELRVEPSFDAFYRVTPGMMASVTVNTDFAQTEIDETRVNLSRFELFFPEKREFFLRDTGIFQFADLAGENGLPFFSRRIGLYANGSGLDKELDKVRLLGGGRLTGRAGRFNIGLLDIQQDRNLQSRPVINGVEQEPLDSENLAVARVSANILNESNVGMILTHGDPDSDSENLLVGADFNYRSSELIRNRFVSGSLWIQQDFSGDQYGDRSTAWGATLSYPNDRINWRVKLKDIGKNFDPALGFVNRRDIRRYEGGFRYRFRSETSIMRTWDLDVNGSLVTDRAKNHPESAFVFLTPVRITTQVDDSFELLAAYLYEDTTRPFYLADHIGIPPGEYNQASGIMRIKTSQHRKLRFEYETGIGTFFDGWGVRMAPLIEWRPSKYLLFSLIYDERRFYGLETCKGGVSESNCFRGSSQTFVQKRNFEIRLVRFRVQVAFNPDVAWSTLFQYDNVSDGLEFQTRLSWIIEPGREVFLVLGQDMLTKPGDFRVRETTPSAKVRYTFRF